MRWTDNGRIAIEGTNVEFIQVSLKKGQENARIGKLNTLINTIYGQQANMPSKLTAEEEQNFKMLKRILVYLNYLMMWLKHY